jgi:hypothetical protein
MSLTLDRCTITRSFRLSLRAVTLYLATVGPVLAGSAVTPTTITYVAIYAGSSGATGAYVVFSPGITGLEGCSNTPGNEVWIDFSSTTEPTARALYATVLAASLAGRAITLEVNGCALGGELPLVYQVAFAP